MVRDGVPGMVEPAVAGVPDVPLGTVGAGAETEGELGITAVVVGT